MVKHRDISIDIVKFLAVFLIINSHADIMYAKYSSLATGGAIGDALFLFCSGYTLFWSGTKRFDNWYKRRISRIYPSVIACLGIAIIFGYEHIDKLTYIKIGGGEFVIAIMVYYILLYGVQRYCMRHFKWVVAALVVTTLVAYWFFPYKYETSSKGIYGITTLFRWIPYFGMMLMGAWIGLKVKNSVMNVRTRWTDGLLLLGCIGVFYGIQLLSKRYVTIASWQIVTLPFLAGIVYYIWKLCNAKCLRRIYENKFCNKTIMLISGLCLESYLIQRYLFTDALNRIFPLNLPIITAYILLMAYICRCVARAFSQTFRTEEYEWSKVFSLK